MIIAPKLTAGGTIGLCSPSHIAVREKYAPIIATLRRRGFIVIEAEHLYRATDTYLASVEERAHDLNQLIHDERVEVILFGGGEGGNEILPYIDYDCLRAHPKRVCSYSDGTYALDAIWAHTGLVTYYGLMPAAFADLRAYDYDNFVLHLMHDADAHIQSSDWRVQTAGAGEGTLMGGYLRNVCLMSDYPYFPYDRKEDYILFLEDHENFGDVSYVSSLLSYLEHKPLMKNVRGVLFGHYSVNVFPELYLRLKRLGEKWGIPVAYCDDFGHGKNHAVLDIGRRVRLDTVKQELTYL